jgi:serine/threonine-protein kinase
MEVFYGRMSVGTFLEVLSRSQLVDPEALEEALGEVKDRLNDELTHPSALTQLGAALVARDLITCWQFQKLCDGKWKGFFLDEYKLLDHLHDDSAYGYYTAEHTITGRRVTVRITPAKRAKNPEQIEYVVVGEGP